MAANRRNAAHSTGPRSTAGKRRSRSNALQHGLTAETVVPTLEDADDYRVFEAAIAADYRPRTAVERHLVARLTSLLWRLRRALLIETGCSRSNAGSCTSAGVGTRPMPAALTSVCSTATCDRYMMMAGRPSASTSDCSDWVGSLSTNG